MLGNLGDMAGLMKKAKQMQENMQKMKEEMGHKEFSGTSGGGQVEVVVKGDFTVQKIKINPECVNKDDMEILEDLISAAVNNALAEAKLNTKEKLSELTGGLSVPGLF